MTKSESQGWQHCHYWSVDNSHGRWQIFQFFYFLCQFSNILSDFVMLKFVAIRKGLNVSPGTSVVSTINIQSWTFAYIWLLNNLYVNGVNLREQILSLKYWQLLELLIHFEKGFRSFHTFIIWSVGQRAAKLLAVKVGGPPKKFCCLSHSS